MNKEYKTQSQSSLAGSSNKKVKPKRKNGPSKVKQQQKLTSVTTNTLAAPLALL